MTLTTHTAMGAVIGQMSGNPFLAFLLGFFIHLLIDIIPHGDTTMAKNFRVYGHKRKRAVAYVFIDAICAIFFLLFIFNGKPFLSTQTVTWAIVGSVLPDLLVGLYDFTKTKYLRWFFHLHFFFHNYLVNRRGKDVPLKYALLIQFVFVLYLQSML
jgi:hypothetical protein